ncbi:unnamed protein product [Sphacelaria rigidula]
MITCFVSLIPRYYTYRYNQLFLTEGALQILVVDLDKFYRDPSCRGDIVYIWLDALLCRLPGCAVLVVATHTDRFSEDRGLVAAALRDLESDIEDHLERKRQEWELAAAIIRRAKQERGRPTQTSPSVTICDIVEASGLVANGLYRIRDEICRLAGKSGTDLDGRRLFPNVGQTVPVSWKRVWSVAEAMHVGGEPLTAATSIGQPVVSIEPREKHSFVTWEVMMEEWSRVVSALELTAEVGETPRDQEKVLQDALKMRQTGGTLLMVCDLVHFDPSWINQLLRALLDHRLADKQQEEEWRTQLGYYCRSCGTHPSKLTRLHKNFTRTGRLTEEYLHFVWREVPGLGCPTVFSRMIETMSRYGAMFTCDPSRGGEKELLVPARLPSAVDADTLAEIEKTVSTGVRMRFVTEVHAKYIPAGIIAQLLGSFCRSSRILFRACWSRGAAFNMNGTEHLVCLHEPTAETTARVEISIAGSTQKAVFEDGYDAMEALSKLLLDRYPGLSFDDSGDPQFMGGTEAWKDMLDSLQAHLERRTDQLQLDIACVRWPVPRLACLLPNHDGTLNDGDRSYPRWSNRLRAWCRDGKKAGRGHISRKLRLFFVCAHDYSLTECGPNGQGYKVKQLREWAAKALPLAKVALALAGITLKVCTGLSIPMEEIDAAFGDSLGGPILGIVKESGTAAVNEITTVARGGLDNGADEQRLEHLSEAPKPGLAPLDGFQYERLKEVINRFEIDGVKTKGDTPFTSFEESMEFVDKHGEGVHWAWVRKKNVTRFRKT